MELHGVEAPRLRSPDACMPLTLVVRKQGLYLPHVGAAGHGSEARGVVVVDGRLHSPLGGPEAICGDLLTASGADAGSRSSVRAQGVMHGCIARSRHSPRSGNREELLQPVLVLSREPVLRSWGRQT